jgi:hypothetical protein
MKKKLRRTGRKLLFFIVILSSYNFAAGQGSLADKIKFIDCYYENASPVNWDIQGDTAIKISLLYDYERDSPNRQSGHWNFKINAVPGTDLKLIFSNRIDIYNGKKSTQVGNIKQFVACYYSYDGINWTGVKTIRLPGMELMTVIPVKGGTVQVASVPPYTITDLENFKKKISGNPNIKITEFGKTVEKRPLEIIRAGDPDAPYSILIRVRAHPWESASNWVAEGIISRLIATDEESAGWRKKYCLYIMPMANKDGVARGMTRFNVKGKDLNRDWGMMSNAALCPEKFIFEAFIESMIKNGKKPVLTFDFHNDDYGSISTAAHDRNDTLYISRMKVFEESLKKNTWFSESLRLAWTDSDQGKFVLIQDGLLRRYGIEGMVYEFNTNWIPRLNKIPSISDWKSLGENLNRVFNDYVSQKNLNEEFRNYISK